MRIIITAVGPDNRGLADPIVHYVTGQGANIAEIQMYDHDQERLFAMFLRIDMADDQFLATKKALEEIGRLKGLSVRVWSPELRAKMPRLAICVTLRQEPPTALLEAIRQGHIRAEATVMIGNRANCQGLAEKYGVNWEMIGDEKGDADDERMIRLCDQYEIDYIILARYMRVLPAKSCWQYAGGRIINLHHGLLPSFPGLRPYHDAHAGRMLTYGATCHFIVPELDAGNQIIYQSTYTVPHGMSLAEIIEQGQAENEPRCLVEGVRRVVAGEVELHFHRVMARQATT
jgi:formyltetrahydrofolate deformylase